MSAPKNSIIRKQLAKVNEGSSRSITSRTVPPSELVVLPGVEHLLIDALSIIETELVRFKYTVNTGKSLNTAEAKTLQGYIRSLVDLSREGRERAKQEDPSKLSNEELVALMQQLVAPKKAEGSSE